MSNLSTKGASLDPPAGTGIKPILSPGNYEIQIVNAELRKGDAEFGDKFILVVETRPLPPPFKGLPKDKTDASKGNYLGQVGWVGLSRWGYKDAVTKAGFQIVRDDEMFRALGVLCRDIGLGLLEWWDNQDGKHATVDSLYAQFEKDKPYLGIWFHACIAGKEYMNGQYLNHELFFNPEKRETGKPFSLNKDKVQKYFESTHLVRMEAKATTAAAPVPADAPPTTLGTAPATATQKAPPITSGNNLDFLNQGPGQDAPKNNLPNLDDGKEPWEMG